MIDFTGVSRPFFQRIFDRELRAAEAIEAGQRKLLAGLVASARKTVWGVEHGFTNITSYEDYAASVPVTPYDRLRPYVMRMVNGDTDVRLAGGDAQVRPILGNFRRQKQIYPHNPPRVGAVSLCRRGLLARRLPAPPRRQPHFRRQKLHTRRQLRQRTHTQEGGESRRPVGNAHRPHKPFGQPCAHPAEKSGADGRLAAQTPGIGRGIGKSRHTVNLRGAVMVPYSAKECTCLPGMHQHPPGMAQPRSIFPRRDSLRPIPRTIRPHNQPR